MDFLKRTWAEIHFNNIKSNYSCLRNCVADSVKKCCVVKADAYGHGALEIARRLVELGVDYFAVATLDEAIELRCGGITTPILILGYTPPECAKMLADNDITQCVYSPEYADSLESYLQKTGSKIKIHIKLDSGMGRIGFSCFDADRTIKEVLSVASESCFDVEGIFTHFAVADGGEKGKEYTKAQYERFISVVNSLQSLGVSFKIRHCANSATVIDYPEMALDMVRLGIALYGLMPSSETVKVLSLKPAMTFKSIITAVKNLEIGRSVGYGCNFTAKTTRKIATVAAGYADGFERHNTGSFVLVNGKRANIVGNICMDQFMIDVTDIDCSMGDEVILFGDAEGQLSADTVAEKCKTISYEIVCAVSKRVIRVYD